MSSDLARARAASVLDVLGDDFWAWWRTCMGLGLLALLLALVMAASLDAGLPADLAMVVKLLITAALATCMATMAYVANKRLHRWRQVGTMRRLPVALNAPRWDVVAVLLIATLAWIALATWACVSVVTADVDGRATAPWVVAMLAVTACSAAFGRWERSIWSQALTTILLFSVIWRMGSVAQTVEGLTTAQLLALAATSALVLAWSLLPLPARYESCTSTKAGMWVFLASLEQPLRAWYRDRFEDVLRVLPVLAIAAPILMAPFVPGQSSKAAWIWLIYQGLVVVFTAMSWHAPEQHWRWRLKPTFVRHRAGLALRLWWALCRWLVPLGAAAALLASPWTLSLPFDLSTFEAYRLAASALPWLVVNIALLMAVVTLWVGLRRSHIPWDGLVILAWVGLIVVFRWNGTYLTEHRIAWSGRMDLLGLLAASTLLVLALATWVWARGSLTGIERWGLASRLRNL